MYVMVILKKYFYSNLKMKKGSQNLLNKKNIRKQEIKVTKNEKKGARFYLIKKCQETGNRSHEY